MAHFKKVAMGIVSVVMASSMALSLAACNKDKDNEMSFTFKPYTEDTYEDVSELFYNHVLGDFYSYYNEAKKSTHTLAERFAIMAQAEAKLYESGVLLPTQANGGNYAVSKVANATVTSVAWGNDVDRLHYAIVANTPIKMTDRQAMKEYRNKPENATQSGADYLAWMKAYLAEHGYTTKTEYNRAYTSDPKTFDVLATANQVDSEPVVQTYDGLIEYDVKNHMQPAMAISIPDSVPSTKAYNPLTDEEEDTVTFTFDIRTGQQWINSQGQKVADFKAEDFATGFQHMLDTAGDLIYLVEGVVVGAEEYLTGTADFDDVGVTVDDAANTITYNVYKSAESYFLTMLSYSVFAPLSKSYYESKGGKLGAEFDDTAESYVYGTSFENIAYCGPYYISEHTAESKMTFTANPTWWNKDTVNARNTETMNWLYNDSSDATKAYTDFKAGTIDGCGLAGPNVASAKADKWASSDSGSIFDTYAYTSAMDSTAFCAFLNVNRGAFANYSDSTAAVSPKSDRAKLNTYFALANVNFRRALLTSIDREAYQAQVMGQDLAMTSISNMYTPGTFVSLPEEVTISVGGTNKTYAEGTMYGTIVQDQLNADGVKITVWKEVDGEYTYTGFNGWYNPEYAKSELEKAITALAGFGIIVDEAHPIEIDYPYLASNTSYNARANVLQKNIETVLEGKVKLNLIEVTADEWEDAGYWTYNGTQANFDIYDLSGWGPDYGDPSTYLNTMIPYGDMTKLLGMF